MRIGIDISQIVYHGTGVSRFTQGLVESIIRYEKDNQWFFLFMGLRKKLNPDLERKIQSNHHLTKWPIPPKIAHILFNHLHRQTSFITNFHPFFQNLDWFITSDWSEIPTKINKVTIVHDLTFIRFPETVAEEIQKVQQKRLFWAAKESKIILADSVSTKDDLIEFLKIDPSRIIVNYPGVEVFRPKKQISDQVLRKFNLSKKKYLLTVSKIEPRKNLKRLIEAFLKIKSKNLDLAIVGQKGWDKSIDFGKHPQIKYLGYLSDSELYSLYQNALIFVFPSLWEGFGYPLVEAMFFEIPIACSNSKPLKEIAQTSAVYFDPLNLEDISRTLINLINKPQLQYNLVENGKKRRIIFSWQRYFQKLIKSLSLYKKTKI